MPDTASATPPANVAPLNQRTITLDADVHGFGDAALTAWISEGSRLAPVRLIHRATGHKADFLRMLGQEVDESADPATCVTTFHAYGEYECRQERGRVPRVLSRARVIGIDVDAFPPRRPGPVQIANEHHEWAAKSRRETLAGQVKLFDGNPPISGIPIVENPDRSPFDRLVVLFPRTCYVSREWPPPYWNELAWRLVRELGVGVIVNLPDDDSRYEQVPAFVYGQQWERIAALMLQADLVIGNDSGPVNLAGTLGVRSLALMGPTRPEIFSHMPEVETLAVGPDGTDGYPCVGCHFGRPYRAACDSGCQALYRLTPDAVFDRVKRIIGSMPATDGRPSPQGCAT
jgi:hypothetical protein